MYLQLPGLQAVLCLGLLLLECTAAGFLWGVSDIKVPKEAEIHHRRARVSEPRAQEVIQPDSRLPNIYAVAIKALEELKSGPFCHQIAAVMLHNNCKLLEGKDDAAVLTDTGRRMTDFVDSYAASLAICDLERGAFAIPSSCSKFTESSLRRVSDTGRAELHVNTREIEECLAGLGKDPSAWNTWVSYKHKALMVCEAGRADSNKAQSVLLYQRLAKVVEQLLNGVEHEMHTTMQHFESRVQETSESLDKLNPQVDNLRVGMQRVENLLSKNIEESIKKSSDAINAGVQNAANLQDMIGKMLKAVLETHTDVGAAHEKSLAHVRRRADEELNVFMSAVAAAIASSATLQDQIELSRIQSEQLAQRQEALEAGMEKLITVTDTLANDQNKQAYQLTLANNITSDLLDTLETATASAASVNTSLLSKSGSKWWLYVVCPAASLVFGSYGLPPSALRNIGLLALGEIVGLLVSTYPRASSLVSTSFLFSSFWHSPTSPLFEYGPDMMAQLNKTELKT
ncbi:hypothetical protein MKZ38_007174 [Zalerion maritima]|uniref:Nuclear membrane fusion protein Kar5 n=1 Tax=Zalerion maritima TaxID=339359 RepID=A0AAD5RMY8_9PEZI|nr:hypothetical protein MKZ38_007174 [Zalerion maritima]